MKVGRPFFCGEFDERIKPAKSFYGSHVMAKTFLEMPRGSSANAKTFFFRFAGLPQTPRQTPRDLREYPQTPKHFPWDLRNFRGAFPKALWPLTARDQRHSPGIRESILSSNSRCLRDHPFPIGNSMQNAFEQPLPTRNEAQNTFCMPLPIGNAIFRAYSLRLPVNF